MRVMVIVKATEDSEKGILPSPELLAAMGKFNEELAQAGILRAADGLKLASAGKRVAFKGSRRMVMKLHREQAGWRIIYLNNAK